MSVNLAAFYVVQECVKLREWKWSSKNGKRKRETTFGSPEFAVGTQRDLSLTLVSETARMHHPISDLAALLQVLVASCTLI